MSWNYRIIYHDDDEHPYYGLHEVFYTKKGKIKSWSLDADVVGEGNMDEGVGEIISALKMMLKDAKNSPVLIHSDMNFFDIYAK